MTSVIERIRLLKQEHSEALEELKRKVVKVDTNPSGKEGRSDGRYR